MAKNIRSEYVKNLLAEKESLGAMLGESTSEAIKSFLGDATNKGIRNILSEAEDSFTEEEVDEVTPELEDDKESKKKADTEKDEPEDEEETDDDDDFDEDEQESGDDEDSDEEVWDSVEDFKGDDGEYDLTGQDKDTVMKVLKAMKPDDGVRIVKKDEKTYELNDEGNGTEYVITIDDDEDDFSDDEDGFDDDPMADECSMNESDLGYDPHYGQDKTAMTMDPDTDDDRSQIRMNAGLPKGSRNNKQRWVGDTKGKMAPYNEWKTENENGMIYEIEIGDEADNDTFSGDIEIEPEIDEASTVANGAHTVGLNGASPRNRTENGRAPHKSGAARANENFERKVKSIMDENWELKKVANRIRKNLEENVVVNASLAKIIKLIVENTTTRDEKLDIVNRFNKVKSVRESKALYESISKELKASRKISEPAKEMGTAINESRTIVESKVDNCKDVTAFKDFMNRLDRIK